MEARAQEEHIARQERTRWSEEEDEKLREYMRTHGERVLNGWDVVSKGAGLSPTRNGKSCRLRWINYLRPGINHAPLVPAEEAIIIQLQKMHGNSWALIASRLQNRTEIQVKNFWNGRGKKNSEGGISNIAGGANVELLVDISGHGLPLPPNSLPPDFVSASEPTSTANPFSFPLPSATFKAWSDQEALAYFSFTSTAMLEQDEFLSTNEMQPYLHLPLQTPSPIPVTGSVPESSNTNEELMAIDPDNATFDQYAEFYPELLIDSGHGPPPTSLPPAFVSASEPNSTANPFSFPLPSATFKASSDQEALAYFSFTSTAMLEQDEFLSTNEMQPYLHLPLQTPSPIPVTGSVPESPNTNEELMEIGPDIATFDPSGGLYPELLMDTGHGPPPTQIAAPENFLSWLVFDSEVDYFSQEQELEMTTTNEMVEKTIEEFFTSSSNT